MLRNLFSIACINRKEKRKLAIQQAPKSAAVENGSEDGSGDISPSVLDDTTISLRHFQRSSSPLSSSPPFISKVVGETSLEAASQESRTTPIDFNTAEVKGDDDVNEVVIRHRSIISVTPSPILNEIGEFVPNNILDSPIHRNRLQSVIGDNIYEPKNSCSPITKPKKLAEVYNSTENSPSPPPSSDDENEKNDVTHEINRSFYTNYSMPYVRSSKSFHTYINSPRNHTIVGGSLRQIRNRRINIPRSPQSPVRIVQLERHDTNKFRLRKRSDARREAVEAGFEPSDGVPRCHSTQSLREVQRTKSYNRSQFQASDLSLNPNGRVVAPCDSTSGIVAPTAIVSPTAIPHYLSSKAVHSRSTYEQNEQKYDVDRRRSLQALTGASSLYQMTNGRSQFTPTEDLNARQHHGTRVRVSSVNQVGDSNAAQQYKMDQRRSVHNINNPVKSSFAEGIKTTSTPKNQIAVAPLSHKARHLSESRDEMRSERRGSGGGMNLPAYHSYLMKHSGEERLVDGPVSTPSDARIAYLEQRIRELEVNQKEQQKHQMTPVQPRHSRSSQFHAATNGNMSTSEQLKMQEMHDDLMSKDRKVAQLEGKLLKAYQRIERLNEEFESRVNTMIYDGERAKEDLTRCVEKIRQLEGDLSIMQSSAQSGDHASEQVYHELRDKIWKQERELQEHRVLLSRLREKESEFEKMRSEKGYLELKNENLKEKLEAKKRAIDELERSVSTLRLEQAICQQSCSSGSTPLADECETMSDIRPSIARPYTKAHSTLGSNNMSPLPHSKSTGLTKSFSNFALNSSKRDDITPMMSRSIREQNRHITMCRAMVVCLKDTLEKLARGENPDVARLLGVKLNMMSESELDEDDQEAEESKPFSMMAAESALSKQCQKLVELDHDLDTIRCQLAEFHGNNDVEGDGDREVCRVQ